MYLKLVQKGPLLRTYLFIVDCNMMKVAFFGLLLTIHTHSGNALRIPTIAEMKAELSLENRLIVPGQRDPGLGQLQETIESEENLDHELMANLKNSTIRVLARSNFPYLKFLYEGENNETIKVTGFAGDLWTILEEHLGFKTKIIIGNQSNTRLWDVLLNPKELGVKRMRKYSYSFPITKIRYNLFAKGVPDNSLSMFYFEVLDKKLWSIIFTALVLLSAFLWLVWKIRMTMRLSALDAENKRDTSFCTCLLSVLGCMTNQGSQFKTESLASIRIITLMCIVIGLIITTSFSALLISKLATFRGIMAVFGHLDVDSLLREPAGRTVCVASTSSAFKRLTESAAKRRSSLKINGAPCKLGEFDIVPPEDYCWENAVVLETNFNTFYTFRKYPVTDDSCPVFIYNDPYYESHMILVAQKGFPFMKIINKYLLRIKESGIMGRLNEKWKKHKLDDDDLPPKENKVDVRFDHIRTIILLYGAVIIIVVVLLVAEKLVSWLKAEQPNRTHFQLGMVKLRI